MEGNAFVGIGIVVVFIVIGVVVYLTQKKRKDSSWTGTILDKSVHEIVDRNTDNQNGNGGFSLISVSAGRRNDTVVTHSYSIKIRSDTNEVFDWDVSSGMYEMLTIGDKVIKRPGTTTPELLQHAPADTTPPTPPTQPQSPVQLS